MSNLSRVAIPFALASSLLVVTSGTSARAEDAASKGAPVAAAPATAVDKNAERALRARVKGFWDARLARSEKTYDFYLPPAKGGLPRADVADGMNVVWQEYEIVGVKIDGDSAWVTIKGRVSLVLPKPMPVPEEMTRPVVAEEWRRTDGVWYRQPVQAGLSKAVRATDSSTGKSPSQAGLDGGAAKAAEGAKK